MAEENTPLNVSPAPEQLTGSDRGWAVAVYLFFFWPIAPIVALITKRDRPFIVHHANASLVIGVLSLVLQFFVYAQGEEAYGLYLSFVGFNIVVMAISIALAARGARWPFFPTKVSTASAMPATPTAARPPLSLGVWLGLPWVVSFGLFFLGLFLGTNDSLLDDGWRTFIFLMTWVIGAMVFLALIVYTVVVLGTQVSRSK